MPQLLRRPEPRRHHQRARRSGRRRPPTWSAASSAAQAPPCQTSPRTASTSMSRSSGTTCCSSCAATRSATSTTSSRWLKGSNSLSGINITSPAFNGLISFQTTGCSSPSGACPARWPTSNSFEYAPRINPNSPMWMGFLDQQTDSSGPAQITTFAGNGSAASDQRQPGRLLRPGQHPAPVPRHRGPVPVLLAARPGLPPRRRRGPATERLMYMFRANQTGTSNGLPAPFNANDPFTNGGCPAFVNNMFVGTNDATLGAQDAGGLFKSGDSSSESSRPRRSPGSAQDRARAALQRSSRASDGTPVHIRMDGPGLSQHGRSRVPDLPGRHRTWRRAVRSRSWSSRCSFPTSEFFRQMRVERGEPRICRCSSGSIPPTMDLSGSSRPLGGRTSLFRHGPSGHSRLSNSPSGSAGRAGDHLGPPPAGRS